jgi:hypothetical protein
VRRLLSGAEPGHSVRTARTAFRRVRQAAALAALLGLLAQPAAAQSTSQQSGRPQPPPAPKPAGPQTAGAKTPPAKAPVKKKPAPPQTSRRWKGRGFVVGSGGVQVVAPGYTSTAVFTVHAEDADLTARATIGIGPAFGVRGGMRVWKNLALGAGLAVTSADQRLDVTGLLPHPFMFNKDRAVSGTAAGLSRLDTTVAFEASWLFALARRVDMFVFGGPAYLRVRQDMATRIQFTETYPYDTASFTGVESASMTGGALGVTAGADVAYLLTKALGVGGQVRYSYASATLSPAGQPSKVGLGGLQFSVSARLLF